MKYVNVISNKIFLLSNLYLFKLIFVMLHSLAALLSPMYESLLQQELSDYAQPEILCIKLS